MFSRSPGNGAKPPLPDTKSMEGFRPLNMNEPRPNPPTPGQTMSGPRSSADNSFSLGSIIGNDLTIVGQGLRIITQGTLQVDGKIEGDVIGKEVIVGDKGSVIGVVSGEKVIVRGAVNGTIKGMVVSLQSSAHVEGDVHHQQLTVEEGAYLEGRVRRPKDIAELSPDLDISGFSQ